MDFSKIKQGCNLVVVGIILILVSVFSQLMKISAALAWMQYLSLLSIPGFILQLVGLGKMRKESKEFTVAFWSVIAALAIEVIVVALAIAFQGNANVVKIIGYVSILADVASILSVCMIFEGLSKAFLEKGMNKEASYGRIFEWIYVIVILVGIVLQFIKVPSGNEGLANLIVILTIICTLMPDLMVICHCSIAGRKL